MSRFIKFGMRIFFSKEEREKHIEFTKRIYSMEDLEGYKCFFDKFLKTSWLRVKDENGSLEEIVELMENTKTIVSSLSLGEDEHISGRYSVNPFFGEEHKLLDIHFDLTNDNFGKIQNLYFEIYGRYLQDDSIR